MTLSGTTLPLCGRRVVECTLCGSYILTSKYNNSLNDSVVNAKSGDTIVINTNTIVSSNLSVHKDISIKKISGYFIDVGSYTLEIDGRFICEKEKAFECGTGGRVILGKGAVDEVFPEWWGVDGISDDIEIQAAIDSIETGTVLLSSNKKYILGGHIRIDKTGITLRGGGPFTTYMQPQLGYTDDYLIHIEHSSPGAFLEHCKLSDFQMYCNTVSPSLYLVHMERVRNFCVVKNVNAFNYSCGLLRSLDRCNSLTLVNLYSINKKPCSTTAIYLDNLNEGYLSRVKLHGNDGSTGHHTGSPLYVHDCSNVYFNQFSAGGFEAKMVIDSCQDMHFVDLVYEPHTGLDELVNLTNGSTRIRFETMGLDDTGDDKLVITDGTQNDVDIVSGSGNVEFKENADFNIVKLSPQQGAGSVKDAGDSNVPYGGHAVIPVLYYTSNGIIAGGGETNINVDGGHVNIRLPTQGYVRAIGVEVVGGPITAGTLTVRFKFVGDTQDSLTVTAETGSGYFNTKKYKMFKYDLPAMSRLNVTVQGSADLFPTPIGVQVVVYMVVRK